MAQSASGCDDATLRCSRRHLCGGSARRVLSVQCGVQMSMQRQLKSRSLKHTSWWDGTQNGEAHPICHMPGPTPCCTAAHPTLVCRGAGPAVLLPCGEPTLGCSIPTKPPLANKHFLPVHSICMHVPLLLSQKQGLLTPRVVQQAGSPNNFLIGSALQKPAEQAGMHHWRWLHDQLAAAMLPFSASPAVPTGLAWPAAIDGYRSCLS